MKDPYQPFDRHTIEQVKKAVKTLQYDGEFSYLPIEKREAFFLRVGNHAESFDIDDIEIALNEILEV